VKFSRLAAVLSLAFAVTALQAQGSLGSPQDSVPPPDIGGSEAFHLVVEQTPSGNKVVSFTRADRAETLYIPPVPGAPFSANVQLNIAGPNRSLENSSSTVARDSAGRVYIENRTTTVTQSLDGAPNGDDFGDTGALRETQNLIDRVYIDPVQSTYYDCTVKDHLCHSLSYKAFTTKQSENGPPLTVTTHTIGQKKIDGLQTVGTSEFIMPYRETDETWYSSDLQIALASKRTIGNKTHSLQVKGLKRSEPSARLFTLPSGYKLTTTAPPAPPEDPKKQAIREMIQARIEKSH